MAAILVVDDESPIREMLTDLLTEDGHAVESCRDGKDAWDRLRQPGVDLLLLDVLIPNINGFEIVEKLGASESLCSLPVIVFSGIYRGMSHRAEVMKNSQVVEYFDKPLRPQLLKEAITKALGSSSAVKSDSAPMPSGAKSAVPSMPETFTHTGMEDFTIAASAGSIEIPNSLVDEAAQREREGVEKQAREDFRRNALVLQGKLADHSVAEVLGKLWREQTSGALLLRQGKVRKIINLRGGHAYYVRSNLVSECLGQLLVKERMISKTECQRSIAKMRETGSRQGELLIEQGAITQNNLAYALELQLETKLFDIFAWQSGEYRFNPDAEQPQAITEIEFQGAGVVVEGIRRSFDKEGLRRVLGRFSEMLIDSIETRRDYAELGFNGAECEAIAKVALPLTLNGIVSAMGLEEQAALRIIYALICLRQIRPMDYRTRIGTAV